MGRKIYNCDDGSAMVVGGHYHMIIILWNFLPAIIAVHNNWRLYFSLSANILLILVNLLLYSNFNFLSIKIMVFFLIDSRVTKPAPTPPPPYKYCYS